MKKTPIKTQLTPKTMKVCVELPAINLANGAGEEYPNGTVGQASVRGWGSNRLVYVTFGRRIYSSNRRCGELTDRNRGMWIPEVLLKRVVEEEPAVAKAA